MTTSQPAPAAPPTSSAEELLRGVAAHGLPGHAERITDDPPDPATWTTLLGRVAHQRVPGLLMAAVDAGALPVTDQQRDEVRDVHLGACTSVLRLEQRLVELVDHLEAADIEVVALTGSAHAHLAYPDPA